jgi:peroxiredoxin/predicted 2-oxoglutarate/Fe(II)-dependent dioxygenase YbiX
MAASMNPRGTRLEVGDYLPMFQAFDQNAILNIIWNQIKGKPIVLVFCPALDTPAGQGLLRGLNQIWGDMEKSCHLFAVSAYPVERNAQVASMLQLGFPLLSDEDHRIADLYGIAGARGTPASPTAGTTSHVFVADPNRQIAHAGYESDAVFGPSLLDLIANLRRDDTIVTSIHAPVLYLPNVLDREFCAALVDRHETGGNRPSGIGRDGMAGRYFEAEKKVRRDHNIRDPELMDRLSQAVQNRIIPEVHKAFNFQITRLEEFKIGRYDADDGGHFYPHRDNSGLGHRRFAMTLNLNTGDYEGGYLRFPEYGPTLYRPDTGDAVIFSCSLLHEATPVTKGHRFMLLGFFFDEEANRLRQTRSLQRMPASG